MCLLVCTGLQLRLCPCLHLSVCSCLLLRICARLLRAGLHLWVRAGVLPLLVENQHKSASPGLKKPWLFILTGARTNTHICPMSREVLSSSNANPAFSVRAKHLRQHSIRGDKA